jgi:hypothetical protein
MGKIEIQDFARVPLSRAEMASILRWTYGDEGEQFARLWCGLNDKLFDGKLSPVPIYQPRATPYGKWRGLYSGNMRNESLEIQLKRGEDRDSKFATLLHEMIHQRLWEAGENPCHNGTPWCNEIMRLTREIWGIEIWASPSVPRKVGGKSKRIQKPSPDGRLSIPFCAIELWPHSLRLSLPMERFIERAK